MSNDIIDLSAGPKGWLQNSEVKQRLGDALGGWMSADTFAAQMLISFQKPALAGCTPRSLFEAAHECAALCLLPSLGQVALIPRKMGNQEVCTVMPMVAGLKAIMERNPSVLEIEPIIVYDVDDYLGWKDGVPQHQYDPLSGHQVVQSDGRVITGIRGGYAKITYRDGRPPKYVACDKAYIEKCQGCAQSKNVWKQWTREQVMKTILRNAYARRAVPIDPMCVTQMETVINNDDAILGNDPGHTIDALPAPRTTADVTAALQAPASEPVGTVSHVGQEAPEQPQDAPEPEPVSEPVPEPETPPADAQGPSEREKQLKSLQIELNAVKSLDAANDVGRRYIDKFSDDEWISAVTKAVTTRIEELRTNPGSKQGTLL